MGVAEARKMIELSRAALCADCSVVYELDHGCPRCASKHFLSLARILNRGGNGPASLPAEESASTCPRAQVPRDLDLGEFVGRWIRLLPLNERRHFLSSVSGLIERERVRERRRLTTSWPAFFQACEKAGQEILVIRPGLLRG